MNNNLLETKVSMFKSCKEVIPLVLISLIDWLTGINKFREVIDKIRNTKDKAERTKLKETLPAATISGVFSIRNQKGLIKHTGLICLDIDGDHNPQMTDMEKLKKKISKIPFILYCGLSVGGNGLFCIVAIENPEKHLSHFYALEKDFAEIGIIIDPACKDIGRLRYLSYDDNGFFNGGAEIYKEILSKPSNSYNKSKKAPNNRPVTIRPIPNVLQEEKEMSLDDFMESMLNPKVDPYPFYITATSTNRQRGIITLLESAISKEIDITQDYNDWKDICCIIAPNFGKDGLQLFYRVSQFYPSFTEDECEKMYDAILAGGYITSTKKLPILLRAYGVI